ncbi:MAG TPA: hypothetical protein IAA58_07170 [Candidatus Gallacutalibacter stercoravium]|nr:hypothetical protein [Candidatus Gallacutalibacter stercoravium]
MWNKVEVTALFEKHAFLVGSQDVVSEAQAVRLFGNDVVQFAKRLSGKSWNTYGCGNGRSLGCLTLSGFMTAATFVNVLEELEREAQ